MTVKTTNAQLGLSVTPANNFTLTAEADNGTMKLARGNAGATTQDILTVDADGRIVQGLLPACIRLNTANGYGSTNTCIRRFTNTVLNQGNDITYADSATLGASFTINKSGIYSVSYSCSFLAAAFFGLSLNSSQLSTDVTTIAIADRLAVAMASSAGNWPANLAWTGYLSAGSVLRPHNQGLQGNGSVDALFTITRVA